MKPLLFISSFLLFLGIAELPIGYYTLLRIIVTIGAISIIVREFEDKVSFWILSFGIIGVLFNPIIPIYLHDKGIWIIIDLIAGIFFAIKGFTLKQNTQESNS